MASILVEDISKKYIVGKGKSQSETIALHPTSFSVDKGELFGCIGPDGAGKTTLIRIMATLIVADTGRVTIEGFDAIKDYAAIRHRIGYMPGRFSLYQDLSVEENLRFFATIFKASIDENMHLIYDIYRQLEPFANRPAGKLSGGMKQKLALCCAMIHKPDVLFLDEPTTGVDAVSRKEFWDMLQRLRDQGITIFVSTPYMDEASLCDRVALMQNGAFLRIDKPAKIISSYDKRLLAVKGPDMYQLLHQLKSNPHIENAYPFGEYHHVVLHQDATLEQTGLAAMHGVEVKDAEVDIEDCFIMAMRQQTMEGHAK
ncbi:MAG: ABC transporter ATP-binding protein [Arcticibacter sp.]